MVTTMTHSQQDRFRSFELIAQVFELEKRDFAKS